MQLVLDRVVTKTTQGEFRTRVIREGVHPSLQIQQELRPEQYLNKNKATER